MNSGIKIVRNKDGQFSIKTESRGLLVLKAIPDVFALQPDTTEYLGLLSNLNNGQRMAASWRRTGTQMKRALREYKSKNGI
jgi:hypothetical protein